MALKVHQFPVLNDNYTFIACDETTGICAVVDPAEATSVENFVAEKQLNLKYIINTHHHYDHVGGNLQLKEKFGLEIFASEYDRHRIPGADHFLKEGDQFRLGESAAEVLFIPGHTTGHIAYYFSEDKVLFCGDTLFAMGCGRLFEGTPKQMYESLRRLVQLPSATKVYCAHEYTMSNGKFALAHAEITPDLLERIEEVKILRSQNFPTIPTTIDLEKRTNPFVRAATVDEFTRLRQAKDNF